MRKLVRDKIPDMIRADGKEPILEQCSEEEFIPMLIAKLREETDELEKIAGRNKNESINELTDIYEVLVNLCYATGTTVAEVQQWQAQKLDERGGFYNRIIWKGNQADKPLSEKEIELLDSIFESFLDHVGWSKEEVDEAFELILKFKRSDAISVTV